VVLADVISHSVWQGLFFESSMCFMMVLSKLNIILLICMLKLMFEWHVTYPHIICMFDSYIYKLIYMCMLKRLKFSKKKASAQWVGLDIYAFLKKIIFIEYGWKCIPHQPWSKQKPLEIIIYIGFPKYMSKKKLFRGHYVKELFV